MKMAGKSRFPRSLRSPQPNPLFELLSPIPDRRFQTLTGVAGASASHLVLQKASLIFVSAELLGRACTTDSVDHRYAHDVPPSICDKTATSFQTARFIP